MADHNHPLITIAMPTYNRADSYLKQAVQSALTQTYSNIEIIVSDNCSTDHTETLVRSFNDSRIQYFKQSRNIGMVNNANFCLDEAKGAYFLLFHDDDLLDHDFVRVCMSGGPFRPVLQDDELPGIHQCLGGRAMWQGGSLDEFQSAAALVGHRVAGYRAAAPAGQGLSALAALA